MTAPARRPVTFRGDVMTPGFSRAAGAGAVVMLIAFWQLASWRGWLDPVLAPSPAEVAASLRDLAVSGELARHLAASLARLGAGFVIGMSAGVALGLAVGLSRLARSAGIALVSALFPIPKIALLPLFVVWFGIGEGSKVATIAFGTFFPTAVATWGAVDAVDRNLVRMGRAFGLSTRAIVAKIVLPGALPGILSGLRIAASIGVVLLVAAEMIGADKGVGALVLSAGNLMRTEQLLAGVVILSLLGLLLAGALGFLERRLLRWR